MNGKLNYIYRQTEGVPHNETALHSHELCEILYFEAGDGELVLENRKHLLFPGALVILPRGTMHFINILSEKPYRRSVINFSGHEFLAVQVLDVSGMGRIISVFERMRDYSGIFSGAQKEQMFSVLLTELILLIENTPSPGQESYGELICRASEYIEKHLHDISGASELCDALHVSRAQLYREFKSALNVSPMRYINVKRLERAKNLLKLGEDATRVCERCGFGDYSAFYRAYKSHFGHSPNKTKMY